MKIIENEKEKKKKNFTSEHHTGVESLSFGCFDGIVGVVHDTHMEVSCNFILNNKE
jgi:hypothetical protein